MARGETGPRHVVKIAIVPFTVDYVRAVAAFNARMRAGNAPSTFLLPERSRATHGIADVTVTQYIALDEDGEVRGGVLCVEHPAMLQGRTQRVLNLQSPLSEGIIDAVYTFVAPQLIKYAIRLNPYAYVVGMGHARNPLPRLLHAMGWTLQAAPFYFRLLNGARCARHLGPLRTSRLKRAGGVLLATSGLATLAPAVLHRAQSQTTTIASQFRAEPVASWSHAADDVWQNFTGTISFGVERTSATLPFFYPLGERSPKAWWLERNGSVEGWFGVMTTVMSNNAYFGDLTVATLTDAVGTLDAIRAAFGLAVQEARAARADLLITNQQHHLLQASCAAAGWREGPSNYLIAASRPLSQTWHAQTAYVTRRDGDGLTHLRG